MPTRREFIGRMAVLAGSQVLPPIVFRAGPAFGETDPDPDTANRNRLVVIFQQGGNDGLNTVIPWGDVSGAPRFSVYKKVRPDLHFESNQILKLDRPDDLDQMIGLHPNLTKIHELYQQGRVAVVQGVDYPSHNYSHFESTDIWHSGQPDETPDSGWIGRHLDRAGIGLGELRGLGIGNALPLMLRGEQSEGVEVQSINQMKFLDGTGAVGNARHASFAMYGDHPMVEPLRRFAGEQARNTVQLVDRLQTIGQPPSTANYLANSLLTARVLMQENLGVECVFVWHSGGQGVGGYDTHSGQRTTHDRLMSDFDEAIEAFLFGTMNGVPVTGVSGPLAPEIANRTLIMSVSEFGRRIGENSTGASAGTDHGAAAPVFIVGPPADLEQPPAGVRLTPGLHGDHPNMGTVALPKDNLFMTTDLRRLYQSSLEWWLGNPDPGYETKYEPLANLFSSAP
ncbi:MAG TPA: DUF1501 domain-containing protein [Actinomycetota bacterium]